MEIKEVLRRAFKYGEIADIKRMRYEPYKMEVALDAIRIIGTSITPKFVIDDENQWVFEQVIKWMHGDESMMAIDPATGGQIQGRLKSGIYLGGNTGSGKSLALQVMSIYRNIDNIQIRINGEIVPSVPTSIGWMTSATSMPKRAISPSSRRCRFCVCRISAARPKKPYTWATAST